MSAAPKLDAGHRKERILLKGEVPVTAEPAVGMPVPDQLLEGHRGVRDHPAAAGASTPWVAGHTAECHHPLHLDEASEISVPA